MTRIWVGDVAEYFPLLAWSTEKSHGENQLVDVRRFKKGTSRI